MEIRQPTESDINEIVALLKQSLGETLMPKTEQYWRWKHIENPFGVSPVLIAVEENRIVGVRAFMKWQWQSSQSTLISYRPVDTATHQDFRGKGVFKKLTIELLKQCEEIGEHFIFNTPNTQSKPGYLKMGWEKAGQLPVILSVRKPIRLFINKFGSSTNVEFIKLRPKQEDRFNLNGFIESIGEEYTNQGSNWHTPKKKEFLKWRYDDVPVVKYYAQVDCDCRFIFRLKKTQVGKELRIVEIDGQLSKFQKSLHKLSSEIDYDYLSVDAFSGINVPGLLSFKLNRGPHVTVKGTEKINLNEFRGFSNWIPTLGDLELF